MHAQYPKRDLPLYLPLICHYMPLICHYVLDTAGLGGPGSLKLSRQPVRFLERNGSRTIVLPLGSGTHLNSTARVWVPRVILLL